MGMNEIANAAPLMIHCFRPGSRLSQASPATFEGLLFEVDRHPGKPERF